MYPTLKTPILLTRSIIPTKVKSANYNQHDKILFKKLLTFFSIFGLPIERRHHPSLRMKLLAILFHIAWALGTTSTTCCLLKLTSSFYIFSLIVKLISLTLWWIIFLSRKSIARLLHSTSRLQVLIMPDNPPSDVLIKLSIAVYVVFGLTPGLNIEYQALTKDTMQPTCFHMYLPLPNRIVRSFVYFSIQTVHQLVNWTLSYIACLLIVLSCREMSRMSLHLSRSITKHQQLDKAFFRLVEDLHEAMQGLEHTLSLTCFFVLIRLFMEFFRVFSLLFNLVKGKPQSVSFINACSYASVTFVLFVALVFSADRMKGNFRVLMKKVRKRTDVRRFLQDEVTLTGWGIFEVNKKLMLSTLASLITYGVLLQQLQQ